MFCGMGVWWQGGLRAGVLPAVHGSVAGRRCWGARCLFVVALSGWAGAFGAGSFPGSGGGCGVVCWVAVGVRESGQAWGCACGAVWGRGMCWAVLACAAMRRWGLGCGRLVVLSTGWLGRVEVGAGLSWGVVRSPVRGVFRRPRAVPAGGVARGVSCLRCGVWGRGCVGRFGWPLIRPAACGLCPPPLAACRALPRRIPAARWAPV